MHNQLANINFITKKLSKISLTCLTAFTVLAGINPEAEAAVITFDAEIYDFSNPNTCMPQLPDTGGKCFVQEGINVEAFSVQETGTPSAFFSEGGHFHPSDSYEAQHFSTTEGLLGVYLTLPNGRPFSLTSLDYQLRENDNAIEGFTTDDTKILISTEFDPTQPVASQFTEISTGNDTTLPFQTLDFSEFDNITQLYITSSGDVNFDNVTLKPIPEPSAILGLLTLGTLGIFSRFSRKSLKK
ncbi:MAG: PEP-CTERM sorting domain-containing protein [Cyanobacteria bacterium P01_G01_bin.49]